VVNLDVPFETIIDRIKVAKNMVFRKVTCFYIIFSAVIAKV
jgi:hypothetical protein